MLHRIQTQTLHSSAHFPAFGASTLAKERRPSQLHIVLALGVLVLPGEGRPVVIRREECWQYNQMCAGCGPLITWKDEYIGTGSLNLIMFSWP